MASVLTFLPGSLPSLPPRPGQRALHTSTLLNHSTLHPPPRHPTQNLSLLEYGSAAHSPSPPHGAGSLLQSPGCRQSVFPESWMLRAQCLRPHGPGSSGTRMLCSQHLRGVANESVRGFMPQAMVGPRWAPAENTQGTVTSLGS